MTHEIGEYHSKDGFFFQRQEDGSVRLRVTGGPLDLSTTLPPEMWGSVVSSMSAHGETGPTWRAAVAIHQGEIGFPEVGVPS